MGNMCNSNVFGVKIEGHDYRDRVGVYGIVYNCEGKIAIIKTQAGYFLPGGGIENVESHIKCLQREFLEETGYEIEVMNYIGKATLYHKTKTEQYICGIGHFYFAKLKDKVSNNIEPDHEMIWKEPKKYVKKMFLEHQAWAISKSLMSN